MSQLYAVDDKYRRVHYHKTRCIICWCWFLGRVLTVSCYGKPIVKPVCRDHEKKRGPRPQQRRHR